ncbi:hypothetical protein [Streptomyces sp. AK02-01A]|uniref:hypothetical protein n=1 Tax=Streptomyces sp. AK02-01A TaxID=3028648 RepID=UPI0029A80BD5|nr:hypothetical protein [Streptomyces sp. AK02-01A]MDX3855242.1 hypothetical protein [Streptomyces sp. AK02-01A]
MRRPPRSATLPPEAGGHLAHADGARATAGTTPVPSVPPTASAPSEPRLPRI